ncbi:hypothetical protein MmTuc01_1885 [Methanosarcina mazei Tuc01]|uniref:Uncharacterized protein n=1 Tax=Methanosarcina mazei Tuc01 TaxID=1236903 RepID=M1QJR7_METMZ|nr:hypothetical protein MmTuc01_1885 [Methanosarcina mazei Tuc01]
MLACFDLVSDRDRNSDSGVKRGQIISNSSIKGFPNKILSRKK